MASQNDKKLVKKEKIQFGFKLDVNLTQNNKMPTPQNEMPWKIS